METNEATEQKRLTIKGLQNRISVLAILIIILSVIGILAWYQISIRYHESSLGGDPFAYEAQLGKLSSIQRTIENLKDFVAEQKLQLTEYQKLLNNLQTKHKELQPIVEADRKAVEAILRAEWGRRKRDIWINRGFSFAAGIGASLVAAFILYLIKFIRTKRQDNSL